jgi:hypothetical protein
MLREIVLLLAILSTASCATRPQVSAEDRTLSFGCKDIVVIARVKNEGEAPSNSENDLLGHSWFSATLNVERVVKGSNLPAILPVKYYGHAAMRQDLDFMLVLKRIDRGYEITTGQLMWLRPHLADHCS